MYGKVGENRKRSNFSLKSRQFLKTFLDLFKGQKKLIFSPSYVKNFKEKSKNIFCRKNNSNSRFCFFKDNFENFRKIAQISEIHLFSIKSKFFS